MGGTMVNMNDVIWKWLSVVVIGVLVGVWIKPAHADYGGIQNAGVWEGTLRNQLIVACFNSLGGQVGAYYYRKYGKPIRLDLPLENPYWHEDGDKGFWRLRSRKGDTLTGTWYSGKDESTLPIRLKLIVHAIKGKACPQQSFLGGVKGE